MIEGARPAAMGPPAGRWTRPQVDLIRATGGPCAARSDLRAGRRRGPSLSAARMPIWMASCRRLRDAIRREGKNGALADGCATGQARNSGRGMRER